MLSQPCTDIGRLLAAAGDARAVIAVSLLPDAARSLTSRLSLEDAPDAWDELVARLKALNVREVFYDEGLDKAQRDAEAGELLERINAPDGLPLLLSGCPSWRRYVCAEYPMLRAHFNALTPHVRRRGLAIRSLLSARLGVPFSRIIHVTVVGCEAQKDRYSLYRDEPHALIGDEYVVTAREIALWLGVARALPVDASPVPVRQQGGALTAGRLQGVLSEAEYLVSGRRLPPECFSLSRVENRPAVSEGCIRLRGCELRYAQVRGLHEAQLLLPALLKDEWRVDLLEVLACAGCRRA